MALEGPSRGGRGTGREGVGAQGLWLHLSPHLANIYLGGRGVRTEQLLALPSSFTDDTQIALVTAGNLRKRMENNQVLRTGGKLPFSKGNQRGREGD